MPSLKSKLLYGALKSVKPLLTGVDIPKQRQGDGPAAVCIRAAQKCGTAQS